MLTKKTSLLELHVYYPMGGKELGEFPSVLKPPTCPRIYKEPKVIVIAISSILQHHIVMQHLSITKSMLSHKGFTCHDIRVLGCL